MRPDARQALRDRRAPHYGAPEQFDRSFGATGPWTDVFALGLVITELVASRRALSGDSVAELAEASSNRARRPTPGVLGISVPRAVEEVLARALAVDPSDRYRGAGELWDAFERALEADTLTAVTLRNPTPVIGVGAGLSGRDASLLTEPSWRRKGAKRRRAFRFTLGAVALLAGLATTVYAADRRSGPLVKSRVGSQVAAWAGTIEPKCAQGMVRIAAGQFFMGSDAHDAIDAEKPSFHVTLDAFCIDLTEVTVRAYKACSDAGRCRRAGREVRWSGITDEQERTYAPFCNAAAPDRADHPINCVDHAMATRFCAERGARLRPKPSGNTPHAVRTAAFIRGGTKRRAPSS